MVRAQGGPSMRWLVTLGALAGDGHGPALASAHMTPAAYRTSLNRVCRSYTVKLHPLEAAMVKAEKANDVQTYGVDLGRTIVLTLAQDAQIEQKPVPRAMSKQMAPILRLLRSIDVHARLALEDAVAREPNGMVNELEKASQLATPLNGMLDRAGLRDCGSNQ